MRRTVQALAAAACAALFAAPALAADFGVGGEDRRGGWFYGAPPAEERVIPFTGVVPSCDAPDVLSTIAGEFNSREATFWNSGLRIAGIDHVRAVAFRPWTTAFFPRRFCSGVAHVAMGEHVREHRVEYLIREELGVFGQSSHDVEWCVVGVERHLHAAPGCAMMRP